MALLCTLLLTGCGYGTPAQRQETIPTPSTPPRSVTISEEAAQQLASRVAAIAQTQGPVALRISEEELTSYLALHLENVPVQDIQIWLTAGKLQLQAVTTVISRRTLRATLTATCTDHGHLQVRIQEAWLDRHRLPRLLCASIEAAINDTLADLRSPFHVDLITLGEGYLIVHGQMRAALP